MKITEAAIFTARTVPECPLGCMKVPYELLEELQNG
jgi:hypothetical protein